MTAKPELWCVRCGQVPYAEAREAQKRIEAARHAEEIPDVLLLLEHPPVYTRGRRTEEGELPMGEEWYRMQGIEVCDTDRGGRVTYHGPGQLVAYPIVSLRPYGDDVPAYVGRLERVMIEALAELGVPAQVIEGLTGVWTAGPPPGEATDPRHQARKIGSIGVHVNRGVTTHGLAVNVNNDLQPFEWIVPCGIEGARMTSICREVGETVDMARAMDLVTETFGRVYERRPVPTEAGALAERVAGLDALVAAGPAARHRGGNGAPVALGS